MTIAHSNNGNVTDGLTVTRDEVGSASHMAGGRQARTRRIKEKQPESDRIGANGEE